MLESLTITDLYILHADLFADGTAVHESIMDPVTHKSVVPVFSDEWQRAGEIHEAILGVMLAVDAEIEHRDARGEQLDARQYGARSAGA